MRSSRRRRVAVVTGSRAEYGVLCSTLSAISCHPKLGLQLAVTGMHLVRKFGHTVDDIVADGRRIDACVPMQTGTGERLDQAVGLSRGVSGLAKFFEQAHTDIVVVLGDRIEAMAGALAGVTTGRIVAHIHGGDVAVGDLDEGLRHAITKLAHLHLAATKDAARRIARMGERPEFVFNVGAPGLDRLTALLSDPAAPIEKEPCQALVVFHPSGRPAAREKRTMAAILRAVRKRGLTATVVYPNSDAGHTGIIEAIKLAKRKHPGRLRVERSLARDEYLRELAASRVLVGNSSSGIIEAALAGTPAVNVGDRQAGRQRSGSSVIDCGEGGAEIAAALNRALTKRPRHGVRTCYGDGRAGQRIAEILARVPLDDATRRKQITY